MLCVESTEFEIFAHKVRVETGENGLPVIKAFLIGGTGHYAYVTIFSR